MTSAAAIDSTNRTEIIRRINAALKRYEYYIGMAEHRNGYTVDLKADRDTLVTCRELIESLPSESP